MSALPDIPRLYTALAECAAAFVYAHFLAPRWQKRVMLLSATGWAAVHAVFLYFTGNDRLSIRWWIPCMLAAVASIYFYLLCSYRLSALDAGYFCARAFISAELAASAEWQLHCWLWPERGAADPLALALLAAVYAAVFGCLYFYESKAHRPSALDIPPAGALGAAALAGAAFAVSNLTLLNGNVTLNIFYIRTLVDFVGVLVLSLQHDQLRAAALQRELAAMDNVLNRQYEQYRQSKDSIRLLNHRYHELKMQIAAIRAEQDHTRQDAALAEMETNICHFETQHQTGNAVLDTLLTAKDMYCQQHDIHLTCVADGRLLNFLSTEEICTIVGTALDNASESAEVEPDSEKRLIRVAIYSQHGFVMLRFENYCSSPVEFGSDGLPRPRGSGTHGGYGLKSVRTAAEKRGGAIAAHWEDNWFVLRVLLPIS